VIMIQCKTHRKEVNLMISVDPIRDEKKIQTMKTYLKGSSLRDYALFVVGINVALRITDLLALKWSDILDEKGNFKEIRIFEGKTNKERRIQLNRPSQRALRELLGSLDGYSFDDYLFQSREGAQKALSRQQALNILKDAAKAVGIKDNVGTHSLRKTWGYHAWKKGFNPAIIMETLNHSNLTVTKRYLGIRQDDINDLYGSLEL
ncbi:MAG: site-specific integrase, partial [Atopostipes sp.]|nr:site-specific integrase [Atopostipes sp.]